LHGAHIFVDYSILINHKGREGRTKSTKFFDRINKIFRIDPVAAFGRARNKILKIMSILSNLPFVSFVPGTRASGCESSW
jgi:hypothetical protein